MHKSSSNGNTVLMSDIAQRVGVSLCTVSRVINNHPAVSKKTRRKVEKAIEEMHYIPNENARTLLRRKSKTIGFIVPDISNPYYAELFQGTQDIMSKAGYSIFLANTGYEENNENASLREMLGRGVDGLILMSFYHVTDETTRLLRNNSNIVAIQTNIPDLNLVETSDDVGEATAIEHLIALGHRKIAFVCLDVKSLRKRYKGYFSTLEKHGIPLRNDYVVEGFTPNTLGYEATKSLLALPDPPTAIAYINDYTACGAYIAVRENGLRIPQDISLVGFDDLQIAQLLDPPLTTIHQPIREMGRSAAQMLLNNMEDNGGSRKTILLPTELIVRGSTASPRKTV